MKPLVLALALAGLKVASVAAESVIDYTKIPYCAIHCNVLAQAEQGCVPPAAPVLDQATYQSCFCLSALLVPLHLSGQPCQPACNPEDATSISQYYNSLCAGPVVTPPARTTTTTQTGQGGTATDTAADKPYVFVEPEEPDW